MEDLLQLVFKSYGIVGVILLVPLVGIKFLWSDNKELRGQLAAANEKINETHSKRVEDAKQIAEKIMTMVGEHAELSKETNMALDRVGDMLSILQNSAVELRQQRRLKGRVSDEG